MPDWTSTDLVAFIGAGAWIPQIVTWISAYLKAPKLRAIPAATVEIGYTTFGPIVNLPISFSVQAADALIDKITLEAVHEKGDRRSLVWKWMNETQHQIRAPDGSFTSEAVRIQQAIALRVGLLAQIDRTVGFQDPDFDARSQELVAKLGPRINQLREQHGDHFFDQLLQSLEFREVRGAFIDNMYWRDGTYTFEVRMYESRLKSPHLLRFQTTLSSSDVEQLRANCNQLEVAFRAMWQQGSPGPTWNWVSREVKRL